MTEIKQHTMQESHSNQTINATTHSVLGQSASETAASPKSKGFLRNLFDDLSIAQVIAGALAAATVFLLSSVIGVAGSLIGAAIGSVISAVSSQVYKKALSASADKLRDASSTTLLNSEGTEYSGSSLGAGSESGSSEDRIHESEAGTRKAAVMSDATRVMNANDIRYRASHGKGEDPALRRAHERRGRKAKVQRQVLVVSVVSSLIAIVISAFVISFATQGQGIGTKTDPILPVITNQAHPTHTGATSNATSDQNAEDNASSSNTSFTDNAPAEDGTAEGSGTTNNQGTSQGSNTSGDTGSSGNSGGSDSTNNSGSSSGSGNTSDGSTGDGSGTSSGSSNSGSGSGSSSNGNDGSGSSTGSGTSTNG